MADTLVPDMYNPQSLNRYAYCLNNPLIYTDPSGHFTSPISNPQLRGWYGNTWAPSKSAFGKVRNNKTRYHQGVDIYAPDGVETKSATSGKVVKVDKNHKDFGKQIIIQGKDDNGDTIYTRYSHLSKIDVKKGDEVEEGQKIGETGKTGNASGLQDKANHLHFEIMVVENPGTGKVGNDKRKDPEEYIDFEDASKEDQTGKTEK